VCAAAIYRFLDAGQPPVPAQVIAVLEGELSRAEYAAYLYREGYAPRVMVGASPAHLDEYVPALMRGGVPREAIVTLPGTTSTLTEAHGYLTHLRHEQVVRALVITGAYHTRRTRAVYRSLHRADDAEIIVVAARDGFDASNWWRDAYRTRRVFEEYGKMMWYALAHGINSVNSPTSS
jgi:uncharacterized SAM-binding protein YcdF (DUF218 family)